MAATTSRAVQRFTGTFVGSAEMEAELNSSEDEKNNEQGYESSGSDFESAAPTMLQVLQGIKFLGTARYTAPALVSEIRREHGATLDNPRRADGDKIGQALGAVLNFYN